MAKKGVPVSAFIHTTKTKVLNSYISSIVLKNSDLWTLINNVKKKVDSFRWQMIRNFLTFNGRLL